MKTIYLSLLTIFPGVVFAGHCNETETLSNVRTALVNALSNNPKKNSTFEIARNLIKSPEKGNLLHQWLYNISNLEPYDQAEAVQFGGKEVQNKEGQSVCLYSSFVEPVQEFTIADPDAHGDKVIIEDVF
jgi:hypothetical protein